MELLTSPKSMLLLNASLEVSHEQSNEWLNEISFWRDEAAFFYTLIVKKTLKSVPVTSKNTLEKIEKELISITGKDLTELQEAVEKHEHFLNDLIDHPSKDQQDYRSVHKRLTEEFNDFAQRFKSLKKDIFAFVESMNK